MSMASPARRLHGKQSLPIEFQLVPVADAQPTEQKGQPKELRFLSKHHAKVPGLAQRKERRKALQKIYEARSNRKSKRNRSQDEVSAEQTREPEPPKPPILQSDDEAEFRYPHDFMPEERAEVPIAFVPEKSRADGAEVVELSELHDLQKQVQELECKVAQSEEENKSMKGRLAQSMEENKSVKGRLAQSEEENKSVKRRLAQSEEENKTLKRRCLWYENVRDRLTSGGESWLRKLILLGKAPPDVIWGGKLLS